MPLIQNYVYRWLFQILRRRLVHALAIVKVNGTLEGSETGCGLGATVATVAA